MRVCFDYITQEDIRTNKNYETLVPFTLVLVH